MSSWSLGDPGASGGTNFTALISRCGEASWVHLVTHSLTQQRVTEWRLATSQEARGISSVEEEAIEIWGETESLQPQLLRYLC